MQDGNTAAQENLPGNQGSSSTATIDPSNQQKTYTEAEVNKMVAEKHSKLDKAIVRLTKERDSLSNSLVTHKTEIGHLNDRLEKLEVERLGDEPDALKLYQDRRIAESIIAKAEAIKPRLAELEAKEKQDAIEERAKDIASEHGIDFQELLDITDGSEEKMIKAAKRLAKANTQPAKNLQTETGIGSGGEVYYTRQGIVDIQSQIANEPDALKRAELVKKVNDAWMGGRIR